MGHIQSKGVALSFSVGFTAYTEDRPMTDVQLGFSIEETDEGFILRHGEVEMRMSKDQFRGLKAQLSLWTAPKWIHPIAGADASADAIRENVLLTLTFVGGTQLTFSLPIPVAGELVEALHRELFAMQPPPGVAD
jgi:hypothetical protein